jgi:hypothetical protein
VPFIDSEKGLNDDDRKKAKGQFFPSLFSSKLDYLLCLVCLTADVTVCFTLFASCFLTFKKTLRVLKIIYMQGL